MELNTISNRKTGRRSSFFAYGTPHRKGKKPVVLPLEDEKSRVKVALDKLSYLKAGWDGLDALPISENVLSNVSQLLMISDNRDWLDWDIEPNTNGTIILRHRSHFAGVSIGANLFSYYQKADNNITGRDAVDFTTDAVLSVMRSLNA